MNLEDDIQIERFLRKELSQEEKKSFEDRLASDQEFKEYFLFEKEMFETLNEDEWSFIEDRNSEEVKAYQKVFESNEIKQLQLELKKGLANYKNEKKKGKLITLFTTLAAAAVLLLFIFKPLLNSGIGNPQLYAEEQLSIGLMSFVERGDESEGKKVLIEAERLFKAQKYKEASIIFDRALEQVKTNSAIYIYAAISHIKLKEYKKAENILESLIQSDLLDAEKGYWYKSLVYLKLKQEKKAKKNLKLIVEKKYFRNEEAKRILEKL